MIVRVSSLAALALALAACGSQDADPSADTTETSVETDVAEAGGDPEGDAAAEDAPEEQVAAEKPALAALTVAGTIDSIVLDGEEPMVIVNGSDGKNYLGVAAPGAIDAILDNTGGIGSAISLECQETDLPPEDGYVWVDGCKLS